MRVLAAGVAMTILARVATASAAPLDGLVEAMLLQPFGNEVFSVDGLDLPGRELYLDTADGARIHAYEVAPATTDRAILFLHGNAGNASHRLPEAGGLAALGARVLLVDYRGYGKSPGPTSLPGLTADAEAGLAHLLAEGVPEDRIVVFGRSLGGAVALQLARGRPLAGVMVESTFPSLAEVARTIFGPPGAWIAGDRLDSRAAADELRAPLLVLHGDRDDIVPYELGRRLFEAAPEPKSFYTIEGAGHNDTRRVGGAAYRARVRAFLEEVAPARPAAAAAR